MQRRTGTSAPFRLPKISSRRTGNQVVFVYLTATSGVFLKAFLMALTSVYGKRFVGEGGRGGPEHNLPEF